MRTSEIFEMQMAYGETGYFDGILTEFKNDVVPQLSNKQLSELRAAALAQILKRQSDKSQQKLPF
jgi:hypothetical protein